MKIEIKVGDRWVRLPVLAEDCLPTVRVAEDTSAAWFHTLLSLNARIASIKVDGVEGRYGVEFDGGLQLQADTIGFCYLSLAKAVQLPDGAVVTRVNA